MTYLLRKLAEETSRRERLAKLRELFKSDLGCEFYPEHYDPKDDELLAFAERVHEIMEAY